MADGITVSNRLDNTTERKLHAKVVDNVLNGPTYASRLLGMAKRFRSKQMDVTVDIGTSSQFEWYTGLEDLNSSAEDTTITLSYTHTAGTQPVVSIMLESFANAGEDGTIPLDSFLTNKAAQEVIRNVSTAIYGFGTGNMPDGLRQIVDDGTNADTIGGQSRSTYSALAGTYTNFNSTLTLAKLGTLDDSAAIGGEDAGVPNINVTDFIVWGLFEQLNDPQLIANYNASGFPSMPVRGNGMTPAGKLGANAGLVYLAHRGRAVVKDKSAPSTKWFKLNEDSFAFHGRTIVPENYSEQIEKVNLGNMAGYESIAGDEAPSSFNGFFHQKAQMMPNKAGTIARYHVIGQVITRQPRLNAQGHTISGLA